MYGSQNLNQQMLKEILMNIYQKGEENKEIDLSNFIEDIKSQIKLAVTKNNQD
ncbi:hypothetical protein [Bacillus sp. MRMR6]|uniref:hypothetical protein n=1 Tax=Bacillus sp. MRMR6 TaxID=1928617 RepID=UPI001589728A|nr:hypothetical protein [Bacillus sp. MRMR6]